MAPKTVPETVPKTVPKTGLRRLPPVPAQILAWSGPADGVRPKTRHEAVSRAKLVIDASQRQEAKWLAGRRRERLSLYRAVGFSFLRVRQAEEVLAASIAAVLDLGAKQCAAMLRHVYDGDDAATQSLLGRLREEAKFSDGAAKLLQEFIEQRSWLMRGLMGRDDPEFGPAGGPKRPAESRTGQALGEGGGREDSRAAGRAAAGGDGFSDLVLRITEVGQCAAHINGKFAGLLSQSSAGGARSGANQSR
jgi:hypothetical protein